MLYALHLNRASLRRRPEDHRLSLRIKSVVTKLFPDGAGEASRPLPRSAPSAMRSAR